MSAHRPDATAPGFHTEKNQEFNGSVMFVRADDPTALGLQTFFANRGCSAKLDSSAIDKTKDAS